MGKIKHDKTLTFIEQNAVFRLRDISNFVGNNNYAKLLLHNLSKQGKIFKLFKGTYTKHEDPTLFTIALKPSYVALENAVSFHNLWEQETNLVLITPRRVRQGLREVMGNNVVVHRILPKYFFGFDYFKYYDFTLPVSDIEKTFIDLVYYDKHISKDLRKVFIKKIRKGVLRKYLAQYPKRVSDKALSILNVGNQEY